MKRRRLLLLLLPVVLFLGCLGVFAWVGDAHRRDVLDLAARQTGCAAAELTLRDHRGALFEDAYLIEGCGARWELFCAAQDPEGCVTSRCEGVCPRFGE